MAHSVKAEQLHREPIPAPAASPNIQGCLLVPPSSRLLLFSVQSVGMAAWLKTRHASIFLVNCSFQFILKTSKLKIKANMRKHCTFVTSHAISVTVLPPPPPPPLSLLSLLPCQTSLCVCIFAMVKLVFSISGREFFVGLSKRTNQRGAEILADAFKVSVDYGGLFP